MYYEKNMYMKVKTFWMFVLLFLCSIGTKAQELGVAIISEQDFKNMIEK